MRRRRMALSGAAVATAFLLVALPTAWLGATSGDRTAPTLSLSSTTVAPGQSVGLSGAHWPAHLVLEASICGGAALLGHQDCDLGRSITFGPADNGVVQTSISVGIPPKPCPCVVLVTQTDPMSSFEMTVPIDIVGAPNATPQPPPSPYQPTVTVIDPRVVSVASWTSWFGAAAAEELVVRVRNNGQGSLRPLLAAQWLDGTTPHVIDTPASKTIPVGRTVTLVAPFSLSTFAWGHKEVVGQVQGTTFDVDFTTGASTHPWGLVLLAALIFLTIVALIVRAVLRRRHDHLGPAKSVPGTDNASRELTETGAAQ
jgi:hypothetical protein